MNTKSITFRLTIWFALVYLISSTLIGVIFYWETKRELIDQTDRLITLHARQIIQQGTIPEMPGMYISETAKTTSQTTFKEGVIANTQMRMGIFPDGDKALLVAHPIEAVNTALDQLVKQLIIAILGIGVLGLASGGVLAKRGLRPIKNLADQMSNISSVNLNQPINIINSGDEIESLAKSFNNLRERLAASFTRERQFIGDLAHEIKTPLAVMKNNLEVTLSKNRSQTDYKKSLSEIVTQIDYLSGTISDVLDLAWAQSDNPLANAESINLKAITIELSELLQSWAQKKHLHVSWEAEENVIVKGKKQRLFRAFLNLVENAVKYTPNTGKIALALTRHDGHAIWEISNSGKGVALGDLDHIWDRFYRSKNSTGQGAGLGLPIAKSIIEAHGGKISIRNVPGKLTTFIVELPI